MSLDLISLLLEALKLIFPAYCANAVPVLFGGGRPLDSGKIFYDGKPIFGKNKTYRGFAAGLAIGTGVGAIEASVFGYSVVLGLFLSLGALFGDLAGAFLKRRLGLAPGELLPVVDQVDFIVGAIVFSLPMSLVLLSWQLVVAVLIITVPLHVITNYCAHKLGLKKNPW